MSVNINPDQHNNIPFDHNPVDTYPVLLLSERNNVLNQLKSTYNNTDVDNVLDLIYQWKANSYNGDAQTLEWIFKDEFKLSSGPRNGSLSGRQAQGNECDIAGELQSCSEQCVQNWFGTKFDIYRGLRHALPNLTVAVLDNPSRATFQLLVNTLNNVTTDRQTADHFSHLTLKWSIQPDKVMLAADHLFPYPQNHQTAIQKAHGELRVNGDVIDQVNIRNIYPRGLNRSLADLFANVTTLSPYEHGIVAGIVHRIGSRRLTVNTPQARGTLYKWLAAYFQTDPLAAQSVAPIIRQIT